MNKKNSTERYLNRIILLLVLLVCLLAGLLLFQPGQLETKPPRTEPPRKIQNAEPETVRTYYVDATNGNDKNPGTSEELPWKELKQLENRRFTPGDRILLKRGETWNETLFTPGGGSAEAPLIIDAYGQGDLPRIDLYRTRPNGIRISSSYICINRIMVQNAKNSGVAIYVPGGLEQIKLHELTVLDSGKNGIDVSGGGRQLSITHCTVTGANNNGILLAGSPSNPLSHVIIDSCRISNIKHNDGITIHRDGNLNDAGSEFLIQNNRATHCGEQGFDITTGSKVLLLNNRSSRNQKGGIVVGHTAGEVTIKGHYSQNEPTQNTAAAILLDSTKGNIRLLKSIVQGNGHHLLKVASSQAVVLHNTLIREGGGAPLDIAGEIDSFYFRNNIVYSPDYSLGRIRFLTNTRPPDHPSFYINHNVYYSPDNRVVFFHDQKNYPFERFQHRFKRDLNSMTSDPHFNTAVPGLFTLNEKSPAIDRAGPVAKIIKSGPGSHLTVDTALPFFENRLSGNSQCIRISNTPDEYHVKEVSYAKSTIVLDRPASGSSGQMISLCFQSEAPDIGAVERNSTQ